MCPFVLCIMQNLDNILCSSEVNQVNIFLGIKQKHYFCIMFIELLKGRTVTEAQCEQFP